MSQVPPAAPHEVLSTFMLGPLASCFEPRQPAEACNSAERAQPDDECAASADPLTKPVDFGAYGVHRHPLNPHEEAALCAFMAELAKIPPCPTPSMDGLRNACAALSADRERMERELKHVHHHLDEVTRERDIARQETLRLVGEVSQLTNDYAQAIRERNAWSDVAQQRGQRMLDAAKALQRPIRPASQG